MVDRQIASIRSHFRRQGGLFLLPVWENSSKSVDAFAASVSHTEGARPRSACQRTFGSRRTGLPRERGQNGSACVNAPGPLLRKEVCLCFPLAPRPLPLTFPAAGSARSLPVYARRARNVPKSGAGSFSNSFFLSFSPGSLPRPNGKMINFWLCPTRNFGGPRGPEVEHGSFRSPSPFALPGQSRHGRPPEGAVSRPARRCAERLRSGLCHDTAGQLRKLKLSEQPLGRDLGKRFPVKRLRLSFRCFRRLQLPERPLGRNLDERFLAERLWLSFRCFRRLRLPERPFCRNLDKRRPAERF